MSKVGEFIDKAAREDAFEEVKCLGSESRAHKLPAAIAPVIWGL